MIFSGVMPCRFSSYMSVSEPTRRFVLINSRGKALINIRWFLSKNQNTCFFCHFGIFCHFEKTRKDTISRFVESVFVFLRWCELHLTIWRFLAVFCRIKNSSFYFKSTCCSSPFEFRRQRNFWRFSSFLSRHRNRFAVFFYFGNWESLQVEARFGRENFRHGFEVFGNCWCSRFLWAVLELSFGSAEPSWAEGEGQIFFRSSAFSEELSKVNSAFSDSHSAQLSFLVEKAQQHDSAKIFHGS